ncbi:MAG: MgtC/SapB family protein [Kastovskya adunca ATA6-11-RM4]|nr:MgtC/SapB family protein [Kastovskya adunca ATA6-11-RM4]
MALLVGAIIGAEREIKAKPAGLRTHMLVSFGSALFVLIPILIGVADDSADALPRVIQGVTAGIGFLGAGEILRESQPESGGIRIRGLTSAAAIWISSALGVAAGCGLWQLSLISAALTLVVLRVFKKLEP